MRLIDGYQYSLDFFGLDLEFLKQMINGIQRIVFEFTFLDLLFLVLYQSIHEEVEIRFFLILSFVFKVLMIMFEKFFPNFGLSVYIVTSKKKNENIRMRKGFLKFFYWWFWLRKWWVILGCRNSFDGFKNLVVRVQSSMLISIFSKI